MTKEHKALKSSVYFLSLKMQIDLLLGKTNKFYVLRFYQLQIWHGTISMFFKRIRVVKIAKCWWCDDVEQSIIYLYTKYQKWRTKRQILKKSRDKAGVSWQRQPEKKRLAELLANTFAVGLLLKFLKDTEVGSREGTVEKWQSGGKRKIKMVKIG